MEQSDFIMHLKEALQEQEIQAYFLDLVQNRIQEAGKLQILEKEAQIQELQQECRTWREKGIIQQEKIEKMSLKCRELERHSIEVADQAYSTNQQLDHYSSIFGQFYDMYNLYLELSEMSKLSLRGIFKEESPDAFIAAGIQPENIDSLWEYTRMQIMNRKYEESERLGQLICYFIDLYNKIRTSPVYALQEIKNDDFFDVDCHIRTSDSKAAGKVKKIYLYGYTNVLTNTLIKKSVVFI